MNENNLQITITVLVDGIPKQETFSTKLHVDVVIKQLLSAGEKQNSGNYQLSLETKTLNPNLSLEDNGVTNGATLSLTKKDGGGGGYIKSSINS